MEELTSSATLDMRASMKAAGNVSPLALGVGNADDAPRDLVRSGGLEVSMGRRTAAAPRLPRSLAPQAPPRPPSVVALPPALVQLRKWRAKAALFGTLAHHPLATSDFPLWLSGPAAFEPGATARDYYRRCWTLLRVHGSTFPLEDVAETHMELAMFLRLGGETVAALAVATECLTVDTTNKGAMELLDWALAELLVNKEAVQTVVDKVTVCTALSRVRVGFDESPGGADRETAVAALLLSCCGASDAAGSARLSWLAARASRLQARVVCQRVVCGTLTTTTGSAQTSLSRSASGRDAQRPVDCLCSGNGGHVRRSDAHHQGR